LTGFIPSTGYIFFEIADDPTEDLEEHLVFTLLNRIAMQISLHPDGADHETAKVFLKKNKQTGSVSGIKFTPNQKHDNRKVARRATREKIKTSLKAEYVLISKSWRSDRSPQQGRERQRRIAIWRATQCQFCGREQQLNWQTL
jgi:hypothetical protein